MNMGYLGCLQGYTLVVGLSKQNPSDTQLKQFCQPLPRWIHISEWAIRSIWLELLTCNFQSYIIFPVAEARLNWTLNGSIFQFTDILNYQSGHFIFVDNKTIVFHYCYTGYRYKYNLSSIQLPSRWWQEFTSSQCVVPPQSHISTSVRHLMLYCSYVICTSWAPGWWRSRPIERFSFKLKSKQETNLSIRRNCHVVGIMAVIAGSQHTKTFTCKKLVVSSSLQISFKNFVNGK